MTGHMATCMNDGFVAMGGPLSPCPKRNVFCVAFGGPKLSRRWCRVAAVGPKPNSRRRLAAVSAAQAPATYAVFWLSVAPARMNNRVFGDPYGAWGRRRRPMGFVVRFRVALAGRAPQIHAPGLGVGFAFGVGSGYLLMQIGGVGAGKSRVPIY